MTSMRGAAALARQSVASYQMKIKRANAAIDEFMRICANPFVSISFGKDSNAMTHLVLKKYPETPVRFLHDMFVIDLYPEIDEHIRWFRCQFPQCDIAGVLSADDGGERTFAEYYARYGTNAIHHILHGAGDWDGVYIGLRAEESGYRRGALRAKIPGTKYAIWQYSENRRDPKAGVFRCSPIDNWLTEDVAAYTDYHCIPTLPDYNERGFSARTKIQMSSKLDRRVEMLSRLRERHPENYNRIIQRFPELQI